MFGVMFDYEKKTKNIFLLAFESSYTIKGKMFTQNLTTHTPLPFFCFY